MDDNVIKQLIKQKQIYETPDGEKFDTELAAIMHIKSKLQSSQHDSDNIYKRIFQMKHEFWNIPPVTSNYGQVSVPSYKPTALKCAICNNTGEYVVSSDCGFEFWPCPNCN